MNTPKHYKTENPAYEPIKVIKEWGLNFSLGNVLKYVYRAGKKGNALEDLQKAKDYLQAEMNRLGDWISFTKWTMPKEDETIIIKSPRTGNETKLVYFDAVRDDLIELGNKGYVWKLAEKEDESRTCGTCENIDISGICQKCNKDNDKWEPRTKEETKPNYGSCISCKHDVIDANIPRPI
jgi:hypothetical protein